MSDDVVIRMRGVGKQYRVFDNRTDNLLDALGLARLMPWRRPRVREFWALRGIDLELRRGQRLGIVGRNGAGKSTMLKLLTENLSVTEGTVEVRGQVRALMDAGAEFHPEFTGYENIRASLTYQGLSDEEIEEAVADIAEFTELGDFLGQPFRTYSAGMQARLAFATATTVVPETLIVDEILSAGDAYFLGKSTERMRALVESGASILLVSHSLDHITMFCDEAIWIDRGRIVKRGSSLEVVKAYQQFTRLLEERRLKAANRKLESGVARDLADVADELLHVRLRVAGPVGSRCEVRRVALRRGAEVEEELLVGGPQDASRAHAAYLEADEPGAGGWGEPEHREGTYLRPLVVGDDGVGAGSVAFRLYELDGDADYAVDVEYRVVDAARVEAEVRHRDELRADGLLGVAHEWRTATLALEDSGHVGASLSVAASSDGAGEERATRRWPGEGSLRVARVRVRDDREERAIFSVGETLHVDIEVEAQRDGRLPLIVGVSLYRLDGLLVSTLVSPRRELEVAVGDRRVERLTLPDLNLGEGRYVFSVGLYRRLDSPASGEAYDLVDRSYEFEVVDAPPLRSGIFHHPSSWSTP